ncbi:MAG TPA: host-nuclease inhibitor Gam family protein [Methylococcus sp.]|nr:host-nuclease inhibitor Gam family protein [Methylococcus sp.]
MAVRARLKTEALQIPVPMTRDDVARDIRLLGDAMRRLTRLEAEMNDRIAEITAAHQPCIDEIRVEIKSLQTGIQTWCEAHRDELTEGGKVKTGHFITGDVQWRQRPPSVVIRGVDAVIEVLKRMDLTRFLRVRTEIDKQAILNEPEAVKGVPGLTIVTGVEDFVVTPFEQEVSP